MVWLLHSSMTSISARSETKRWSTGDHIRIGGDKAG
jgi:hypothetical protein